MLLDHGILFKRQGGVMRIPTKQGTQSMKTKNDDDENSPMTSLLDKFVRWEKLGDSLRGERTWTMTDRPHYTPLIPHIQVRLPLVDKIPGIPESRRSPFTSLHYKLDSKDYCTAAFLNLPKDGEDSHGRIDVSGINIYPIVALQNVEYERCEEREISLARGWISDDPTERRMAKNEWARPLPTV
ncbi:hypothetical protein PM082_002324 [Marasmius tenuissimus]|nr:hypothetical protein PM082_002324 [Marasmius tenuissimus]